MKTTHGNSLAAISIILWIILTAPETSRADTIRGVVSTSGSPQTRKTLVTSEPEKNIFTLCPSNIEFALEQMTGAIVSITGDFVPEKKGGEKCLRASNFEVHEIAAGRPAIIGKLIKIDKNKYAVKSGAGKTWNLARLPGGLEELVNFVVICDLVASESATGELTWLVARAYAMPVP